MARFLLAVIITIGIYGCAALPTPIPYEGAEAASLYRSRCAACHALAHPKRFTARQWNGWLPRMRQIMKERGAPAINEEEWKLIEKYLTNNAR